MLDYRAVWNSGTMLCGFIEILGFRFIAIRITTTMTANKNNLTGLRVFISYVRGGHDHIDGVNSCTHSIAVNHRLSFKG
ncbi:MAG: hypothetical protein H6936_02350 [Burkholderiales bacterium]|nr:hypothetical protein [Burkholderiales bacterium]